MIYAYLTLCEIFEMKWDTKESMLVFLSLFKKRRVAHCPGENVLVATNELLGVCKRLSTVDVLTAKHVFDVVTGLSNCNTI